VAFAPGTLGHLRPAAARAPWLLRPGGSNPGTEVRFFSPAGEVIGSEQRDGAVLRWMNGFAAIGAPEQISRLEVNCLIRATDAGTYQLGVTGIGRFRLLADEELEAAVALAADSDVAVVVVGTTAEVESDRGPVHRLPRLRPRRP
jgi:beta-glucosidase